MYKFTNGVVVYDEETRDKYINAGMILVQEEPKKEEKDGEKNLQSKTKSTEFGRPRKRTGQFGNRNK